MRQLERRGRYIPHGPDVGRSGLEGPVNLDVLPVELDACVFQPDALAVRSAAHRHQADIRLDGLRLLALGPVGDLHAVAGILDLGHLHAGEAVDALLLESASGLLREILVLQRGDPRQGLEHPHLHPE